MSFSLRRLAHGDAESYRSLRLRAFQEDSASFSESYEDEREKSLEYFKDLLGETKEHFTLGCFSEPGQLAGFATFKRDQRQKARHKSFIHTMYVLPEFRGQKIAERILRQLMDAARALPGLEQIHLWVLNPLTSPARRLYLKAGFLAQGPLVRNDLYIDGKYVDAEYMTFTWK